MKLSIIIINYKSRTYLESCLASICAKINASVVFEVVVVNNGAENELDGLVVKFSLVRIIQNSQNTGFGSANNLGVKVAQGEVLFFLNPDAELVSGDILSVLGQFENDSALGVLGLRVLTAKGEVQKWIAGGDVTLWYILKNNFKFFADKKYWQSEQVVEVSWVAGTALLIKKELFLQLGGFDEHFFMYFEDVDLCKRARLLGKKVVYFPQFSILHHGGKSFSEKKKQKKEYYSAQDYYFQKHLGFFQALLLKILRFFSF